MDFESATPSVVKSIKQRDLLNSWIRLYVPDPAPKLKAVIDRELVIASLAAWSPAT